MRLTCTQMLCLMAINDITFTSVHAGKYRISSQIKNTDDAETKHNPEPDRQ